MNYVPGQVPTDPKDIPAYLQREQQRMVQLLAASQDFLLLRVLYAEPAKKPGPMLALADGVSWNPGSGAGLYRWNGSSWISLG